MDREKYFESLSATESITQTFRVVSIKAWLTVSFFIAFVLAAIFWAIFGTIPIIVTGTCVALNFEDTFTLRSPVKGVVETLLAHPGEKIKKGQLIALIGNEGGKTELRSPSEGTLIWMEVIEGEEIESDTSLIWIERKPSPENLNFVGFLPLYSGQRVKVGLKARTILDTVDVARYGMIEGVVKEVLSFPESASGYYMKKIPSESLRNYLLQGKTPKILVLIRPLLDPNTPSKLAWTSQEGPPVQIQQGALGEVLITLEKVRPISYLFPKKARR